MNASHLPHFTATLILIAASAMPAIPTAVRAQDIPQDITLILADYAFSPATIEVQAGSPVSLTLTNKDGITPHNFTLQDTDGGLDIDTDIAAGASMVVEFTPEVAGTYAFYCNKKLPFMKSHRDHGMEGTLTVRQASSD